MDIKDIDEQLRDFEKQRDNNWQRLIYNLRRHLDIWGHKNVKTNWGPMKLSYWPIISNISIDGSTATEITKRSMIIKQTMSRTTKELEENGMIISRANKKDKRSEVLELTPNGKQFILDAYIKLDILTEAYKSLVGEKDLNIAIDVLNKIILYHESLNEAEEETM